MDDAETNREDSSEVPKIELREEKIIVIRDKSKQPLIPNIIAGFAVLISQFYNYNKNPTIQFFVFVSSLSHK